MPGGETADQLYGGVDLRKIVKDWPASIRARLTAIAKNAETARTLDSIVLIYMQERLLYRLSVSNYAGHFVLKGGLLLYSLHGFTARPTQDMDFLGEQSDNDAVKLRETFQSIAVIECEDGVIFGPDSIIVIDIFKDEGYPGKRLTIQGKLGVIPKKLQIDIGFGDAILPGPVLMDYPVLLDGIPVPRVYGYSLESVIAEKFEAMVKKLEYTSRMKDFFDLYYLAVHHDFDGPLLQKAIAETFNRRRTLIESGELIFENAFSDNPVREQYWRAFQNRIAEAKELSLPETLMMIRNFLHPVWEAICAGKELVRRWSAKERQWL
jgi:predicted nucleotidyltransferase component of viral defense system